MMLVYHEKGDSNLACVNVGSLSSFPLSSSSVIDGKYLFFLLLVDVGIECLFPVGLCISIRC